MGVREEYIRILTEVKGAQAIPDLEASLANLGKEAANLKALFDLAAISDRDLASEMNRVASEVVKTKDLINQLKGGGGISGQGVMGLSFAVQDFMSANGDFLQGLYRIQNNIPVLLNQLGMGAGLAGTISLVSLGIGLLLPHIAELAKKFSDMVAPTEDLRDKLDQLKDKAKELEKIDIKTNIETRDLEIVHAQIEDIKSALEALKRLRESMPTTQREAGAEFTRTFAELAPGGPRAATNQIVEATYQREKAAFEAKGGELEAIKARAHAEKLVAAQSEDSIKIAEIEKKEKHDIAVAYRRLRDAVEQRVGAEARGAERGETPQIEAFARRAERVGMGPLGAALRTTTQEAMTASRQEEEEFQRGIEGRKEAIERRKINRQAREKAEGEASDLEAHEFERELDDRRLQIAIRKENRQAARKRRHEQQQQARQEAHAAAQEAHRIGAATNLDEQLEAMALAGGSRAAARQGLLQRGIDPAVADQMLDIANKKAQAAALGPGGAREAGRELQESMEAKQEKLGKDIAAAQIKEAIRGGAYGAGPAGLPEDVLNQLIKGQVIPLMARGANADAAIITVLQQAVYNTQMLMMQYNTQQGILNNLNSIVAKQYNDMYRTQNGAQQHFLPHGGR